MYMCLRCKSQICWFMLCVDQTISYSPSYCTLGIISSIHAVYTISSEPRWVWTLYQRWCSPVARCTSVRQPTSPTSIHWLCFCHTWTSLWVRLFLGEGDYHWREHLSTGCSSRFLEQKESCAFFSCNRVGKQYLKLHPSEVDDLCHWFYDARDKGLKLDVKMSPCSQPCHHWQVWQFRVWKW